MKKDDNTNDLSLKPLSINLSEAMQVNIVKPLNDCDFLYMKHECDNHNGWDTAYEKNLTKVWTKPTTDLGSKFYMFKVRSDFLDVPAEVAYDVIQDSDFRQKWDTYMISTVPIGYINPNNDICYYSMGFPPFQNRDFVLQRSWLDMETEKYVAGHSVWHDLFPPTKEYIRGIVHFTVFFVRKLEVGCQMTYVTHSDPKGKLPAWFINRLTKLIAPRLVKKLHKACLWYPEWKKKHNPKNKPWLNVNIQTDFPLVKLEDCQPKTNLEAEIIDESAACEQPILKEDNNDED